MPVFNGAAHLGVQLDSLTTQDIQPAALVISDDGSTDRTGAVISSKLRYAKFPVQRIDGPRLGYGANVCHLIRHAPQGMIGFCDQDDVWFGDRLSRAINALRNINRPALHVVSRQIRNGPKDAARRERFTPVANFRTSLFMNAAPANATVLNASAADLIRTCLPHASAPKFPDWWIFSLILGVAGVVIYDAKPGLIYRQHGQNALGTRDLRGWTRRARYVASGRYAEWVRSHLAALAQVQDRLTPAHRSELQEVRASFASCRSPRLWSGWARVSSGLSQI